MIITDRKELKKYIKNWCESSFQQSGYDLIAGNEYTLNDQTQEYANNIRYKSIDTPAFICIYTNERIELPNNVTAFISATSSMSREGVLMNTGKINPGFKGKILIELTCLDYICEEYSFTPLYTVIGHVTFFKHGKVKSGYNGSYQNQ